MYRILKCQSDAYIQNRIYNNSFRTTDANTGYAGTLDLFKLFAESTIGSNTTPFERSRLLVKFDLNPLRSLTGSILDISDSSFVVKLVLKDIVAGQPTPSNFTVAVHPLSMSFDEGVGRDVGVYADLDACNWVTASVSNGVVAWNTEGAAASGVLGQSSIDIIASGNLNDGNGLVDLFRTQTFSTGEEDLDVDITAIVSATLAGLIPDCGFRIAFADASDSVSSSLFIKRFASRHVSNQRLRPSLRVSYDDSYQDNHRNFVFDTTGSLFLHNVVRGVAKNIVSGAAGIALAGSNAMTLKLISGNIAPPASSSFTSSYVVNQYSVGNTYLTGVYVASFAVSSFDANLKQEIYAAGSASFHTVWGSIDGTVGFYTGSLVIKKQQTQTHLGDIQQLSVSITSMKQQYRMTEVPRIRVDVFDMSENSGVFFSKLPVKRQGEIVSMMYWRLVDVYTDEVIIPFDDVTNATRMSSDSESMFFDFYAGDLTPGRIYGFEFLVKNYGGDVVIDKNLPTFRIVV